MSTPTDEKLKGSTRINTGSITKIFYADHAERYKHLPEYLRVAYPDAVQVGPDGEIIERTKDLADLTGEDLEPYGDYAYSGICVSYLLAKDIPPGDSLSRVD